MLIEKGLIETPDRIARMYEEIFSGHRKECKGAFKSKTFEVDSNDLVFRKGYNFLFYV